MQHYEVNIDFDEAQRAWMANKKKTTELYVCICMWFYYQKRDPLSKFTKL